MSAGQCPRLYRATFLGMCGTLSRHRIITRRGIMGTIKPSISRNSVLAYYRIVSWRGIPDHHRTISRRGSRTITRPSHGVVFRTISKSGIQDHHLIISQPGIPGHLTAWHPGPFHGLVSRAISRPGIPDHLTAWHPGRFHGLASRTISQPGIQGHLTSWHPGPSHGLPSLVISWPAIPGHLMDWHPGPSHDVAFRTNSRPTNKPWYEYKYKFIPWYHSFMAKKNIDTDT